MNVLKFGLKPFLAVLLSVAALGQAAAAGATVKVSLWDKGSTSMDMMDGMKPMGMAMMGGDMAMSTMGIRLDQATVAAGEVTFEAANTSKDLVHEMIVSRVVDPTKELPYIADEMRVDEEAAGHLGEVAELEPGKAGALTLTLEPGTYILFCNIPGHYLMGMWTLFTVT